MARGTGYWDEGSQRMATDNAVVEWQIHWGRLLRTARQVAGLTLSQLSATSGLSKGYLSKLESGHEAALNPSRATLAALARALPSFRAVAHTLEPSSDLDAVAFRHAAPEVSHLLLAPAEGHPEPPVALGWQELEVIMALVTLDRGATAQPLTATLLARALGRPRSEVEPVLERLTASALLHRRPPLRMGGPVTYECVADFEQRLGVRRPGDALVLAAALLSRARAPRGRRTTHEDRDADQHGEGA